VAEMLLQKSERIRTWYVYWIVAPDEVDTPLYIGVTSDLKRRGREHRCSKAIAAVSAACPRDLYYIYAVKKIVGNYSAALRAETTEILLTSVDPNKLVNKRCPRTMPSDCVLISRVFLDPPDSISRLSLQQWRAKNPIAPGEKRKSVFDDSQMSSLFFEFAGVTE